MEASIGSSRGPVGSVFWQGSKGVAMTVRHVTDVPAITLSLLVLVAYPGVAEAQNGAAPHERSDEEAPVVKEAPVVVGEEEQQEGWKFVGTLNRAALYWNDGDQGLYVVDNAQDSSGFGFEGYFTLGNGWSIAPSISFDTIWASSDSVDQLDANGDGASLELSDAYVDIGHDDYGHVFVGVLDSASDGVDDINLADVDAVSDASVDDWNDNFFLRLAGLGLAVEDEDAERAELRWGDYLPGPFAGESGRFVAYRTPEFSGFEAAASIGRPQDLEWGQGAGVEFTERNGGVYTDLALLYGADIGETFRVEAGAGIWRDTTEEDDAEAETDDRGVSGSFAIRHNPTGINFAVNAGLLAHEGGCEEPGALSGECAGNERHVNLRAGVVRDVFEWGQTAFYGEAYRGWTEPNDSDEAVLRTLELAPRSAEELTESVATAWGFGVVQTIEPGPDRPFTTELYLGYRNYDLDLNLRGSGGAVASRDVHDMHMVLTGATISW